MPVKVYSSGMYVRLGFAIAVTLDPEILVIDEIIAVGDEEFQRRCFDYLYKLRRRGVTIVFVTHSMGLVEQLCDGAAWLEHGKLKIIGTASEVVEAYMAEVNAAETQRLVAEGGEVGADAAEAHDQGSGEVVVDRVEFLDSDGNPQPVGQTGRPLTFRIHYRCLKPISGVTFAVGARVENGLLLAASQSRLDGLVEADVVRDGYVDYTIDSLSLNPGTYEISAVISDHSMLHMYDHWRRAAELTVQPQPGHITQGGVVEFGGRWTPAVSGGS